MTENRTENNSGMFEYGMSVDSGKGYIVDNTTSNGYGGWQSTIRFVKIKDYSNDPNYLKLLDFAIIVPPIRHESMDYVKTIKIDDQIYTCFICGEYNEYIVFVNPQKATAYRYSFKNVTCIKPSNLLQNGILRNKDKSMVVLDASISTIERDDGFKKYSAEPITFALIIDGDPTVGEDHIKVNVLSNYDKEEVKIGETNKMMVFCYHTNISKDDIVKYDMRAIRKHSNTVREYLESLLDAEKSKKIYKDMKSSERFNFKDYYPDIIPSRSQLVDKLLKVDLDKDIGIPVPPIKPIKKGNKSSFTYVKSHLSREDEDPNYQGKHLEVLYTTDDAVDSEEVTKIIDDASEVVNGISEAISKLYSINTDLITKYDIKDADRSILSEYLARCRAILTEYL